MMGSDLFDAVGPVIRAFEEMGIAYYTAGSVAASAYGLGRTTRDVDLVADLRDAHIEPWVRRLGCGYYLEEEAIRDAVARRASFHLIHLGTMIKVDVFIAGDKPYDREALARRREHVLDPSAPLDRIVLPSPEDIVLSKPARYRAGGAVAQQQWADVLGVLRVQETLDADYLRRWAAELDVADLLAKAVQEAGVQEREP